MPEAEHIAPVSTLPNHILRSTPKRSRTWTDSDKHSQRQKPVSRRNSADDSPGPRRPPGAMPPNSADASSFQHSFMASTFQGAAPEETPMLLQLCHTVKAMVASGQPLQRSDIQTISTLLGGIPLRELGVFPPASSSNAEAKPQWCPPITYLHIHECQDYAIGIFCLPKYANIPLHNHPEMTVFSRLLYGNMHVKSFDVVAVPAGDIKAGQCAVKPVRDSQMDAAGEPSVLFPSSGGNIHSFTAVTDCAVLDVLLPPYAQGEGRDCTYYQEVGVNSGSASQDMAELHVLEEFEPPVDFVVMRGTYGGIAVDVETEGAGGDDELAPAANKSGENVNDTLQRLSIDTEQRKLSGSA